MPLCRIIMCIQRHGRDTHVARDIALQRSREVFCALIPVWRLKDGTFHYAARGKTDHNGQTLSAAFRTKEVTMVLFTQKKKQKPF